MFSLLVKKELTAIIQNPKFITTFAVSCFLIILTVLIGISEYKHSVELYNTGISLGNSKTEDSRSWHSVSALAYREPDPMQIFVSGVTNDVGRFSNVNKNTEIKLQNSSYSDDPVFAMFRNIDFSFIFTIVLSLFAVMFTYNTINGEKEEGTLKLVFSNSISRVEYISSKILGSWLGLIIPLLIPILLSYLILIIFDINFTSSDWTRLLTLTSVSLLYYSFFIIFGIFISATTRSSSTSFLVLLTFWLITVFIIPRIGIMAASQLIQIPSEAEIESQIDAFTKDTWNIHMSEISKRWSERNKLMEGMTAEERSVFRDDNDWNWMQEDDATRKKREEDITEYSKKIYERYRNDKIELRRLALTLSRFSPASAYQLTVMNLANTDIELKSRYEESISNFRNDFLEFTAAKAEKDGGSSGLQISMDSETGISVTDGRKDKKLDFSELPKFISPENTFAQFFRPTIIDIGTLLFLTILSFGIGVFRFAKYDLR